MIKIDKKQYHTTEEVLARTKLSSRTFRHIRKLVKEAGYYRLFDARIKWLRVKNITLACYSHRFLLILWELSQRAKIDNQDATKFVKGKTEKEKRTNLNRVSYKNIMDDIKYRILVNSRDFSHNAMIEEYDEIHNIAKAEKEARGILKKTKCLIAQFVENKELKDLIFFGDREINNAKYLLSKIKEKEIWEFEL